MPSKSSNSHSTTNEAAVQEGPHTRDTAAVTAQLAGTAALPPSAPDTAATRAVWAALIARPGSAAAEVADAARISRSAAAKTLVLLEKAGQVTRVEGGREGSKRQADQWQPAVRVEAGGISDGVAGEGVEQKPAENAEPPSVATSGEEPPPAGEATEPEVRQRLRPGELRARVLEYVRTRPREELAPTAVARALNASAGAVSNALDRLVDTGDVVRKSDSPRRFAAAAKRR